MVKAQSSKRLKKRRIQVWKVAKVCLNAGGAQQWLKTLKNKKQTKEKKAEAKISKVAKSQKATKIFKVAKF